MARQAAAQTRANNIHNNQMNVDNPPVDNVKMIILDGVVMAPTVNNINYLDIKLILTCTCKHCAFQKCTKDLKNARGGAFCNKHKILYGNKCCIIECAQPGVCNSLACQVHQAAWQKYKFDHSHSSLAGVQRMLQRPGEMNLVIIELINLMTIMRILKFQECIILDLAIFTVLKQFVHHVVLLLHG